MRCLAKDRRERPASAAELARALAPFGSEVARDAERRIAERAARRGLDGLVGASVDRGVQPGLGSATGLAIVNRSTRSGVDVEARTEPMPDAAARTQPMGHLFGATSSRPRSGLVAAGGLLGLAVLGGLALVARPSAEPAPAVAPTGTTDPKAAALNRSAASPSTTTAESPVDPGAPATGASVAGKSMAPLTTTAPPSAGVPTASVPAHRPASPATKTTPRPTAPTRPKPAIESAIQDRK
jgi:hypothetical protein